MSSGDQLEEVHVQKSGPDYGTVIVGKCLGPTTSKAPTKDGCIIFWTYISLSITDV